MESEIQINNTAGVCQIDIEGTIGVPEEWQFEEPDARVATYERFRDTLRRIAEIEAPEVVVNIRSTGGDVNDALLIHDALRQLPARVTTRCYGYTASAATIIAQAASAVLVLAVLLRTDICVRLELRRLRVHWDMLGKIMQVGIPAALQMAVTAFSNVFVQSYINRFGPDCMSGWTAYTKIDQLMFLPMQSLALSATTFVGQNLGAGNAQRAHQGTRRALAISLAVTAVLMVPVLVLAPQLTAFFNRKAEGVAYGTLLLRYISPFYLLCCINQIYSGALRGAGNSQVPMVIMLGSFVVFRQIYLYIMSHYISNALLPLAMGYPAGWLVCSAATLLYYRRAALGRRRLVEDN